MKEKYSVKEPNGWWYQGKFYLEGSIVELTMQEHSLLKDQVKLQPVTNK